MLLHLTISDFAIIPHLEIHFRPGLNILSGETGAGKSIIINAVNLILGTRASSDLIRSGAEEARVEALFELPDTSPVKEVLTESAIPSEGDLVIRRHISKEGRNKVYVNGSMVTLQMLSRVGLMLISVSGQHEHQVLLRPENHLYVLDGLGGLGGERLALSTSFEKHLGLKERLRAGEREIREAEEREELRAFQREEIQKADIKAGEDALLETEKKGLLYAEELIQAVNDAYHRIYERENSLVSEISTCVKRLEKGAELDRRVRVVREGLGAAKIDLEEAALSLRELKETLSADPRRLEEVDERLHLLGRLKKKYGPTLQKVLEYEEGLAQVMEELTRKKEDLKEIVRAIGEMEDDMVARARALSVKRRSLARELEASVRRELGLLDMAGTAFEVRFQEEGKDPGRGMQDLRPDGYDRVEFMISPNVGEELKPLSRIASGGELSRIMLALKTILARTGAVETLIFDEIDSGIGGATAEVVGEKLDALARYHQILCITHLPQIASKGSTHFLVKKSVAERRTQTTIVELGSHERVKEIARLLAGKSISRQAMAHAKEMLES